MNPEIIVDSIVLELFNKFHQEIKLGKNPYKTKNIWNLSILL